MQWCSSLVEFQDTRWARAGKDSPGEDNAGQLRGGKSSAASHQQPAGPRGLIDGLIWAD